MKKFPVISENGNEYVVKIRNPLFDHFAVGVFVKKKIFGITYNSQVNHEELGGAPWYDGIKYDYDFVKMAQVEVARVEEEWAEESRRRVLRGYNAKKFAEWDGDCR